MSDFPFAASALIRLGVALESLVMAPLEPVFPPTSPCDVLRMLWRMWRAR